MKALSLWNPWATLLVCGAKRVETRSWPIKHRGPLLIHAAKLWRPGFRQLCRTEPYRSALRAAGYVETGNRNWNLPFGAIIGLIHVRECVPVEKVDVHPVPGTSSWVAHFAPNPVGVTISTTEEAFGDYSDGRYAFLTEKAVRFVKPIPYPGRQTLFDVPDGLLQEALAA